MTLIIGDIHGCYDELQALLEQAGVGDDEPLIALGDLVDRGPASAQVLHFFHDHPHALSLMGNHERAHIRAARGKLKLSTSQRIVKQQYEEGEMDYSAAVAFMASLPLYLELPEAILVHGYVEPGVLLEEQRAGVLTGTIGGDKYLAKQYGRPWYELYDRQKPLIVGHRDYNGDGSPFVYQERVYGLDSGCYKGKRLTGLLLPDFHLVSVPSRRNYWPATRRMYARRRPDQPPAPPEKMEWPRLKSWAGEREQCQEWVRRAEAAHALFPQLYQWANSEHERLLAAIPDYELLSKKKQRRRYDQALKEAPKVVRRLLHRIRQERLAVEGMAEVVRSLTETDALLEYQKNH